ncbi:MAG: tRNA (cytidine(34)-2'-O)-methyltransferase [Candidatus Rhabdochlamydia sp.]
MQVVLYQPQIPQNTGNIVRTCACTGSSLILVPPLGFKTSNRWLKRAGLDYWEGVNVTIDDTFEDNLPLLPSSFYFFSSKATKPYTEIAFQPTDYLIFGSETAGLPPKWLEEFPDQFYTIPMLEEARCLNLSNSVAIVLYEAWRQQQFLPPQKPGSRIQNI